MNIETLRDSLPAFAKDTKLNLGTILTPEGAPDLTQKQIYGVALSSAQTYFLLKKLKQQKPLPQ
jgi:lipoyl-dependent peroxiredoxin subunit D